MDRVEHLQSWKIKNKIIVGARNINKEFGVRTEVKSEDKKINLDLLYRNKFLSVQTINCEDKSNAGCQEQWWNEMYDDKISDHTEVDKCFEGMSAEENDFDKV